MLKKVVDPRLKMARYRERYQMRTFVTPDWRETILAIEADNDTYCQQTRIEKFPF